MQQSDIDPGPCPHCGGELKWKATVGAEKTPEAHFYQCGTCDHIRAVEQTLDYAADRPLK